MEDRDVVTLAEAQAATGVSRATLYRLMGAKKVTPQKFGLDKRTYISLEELRAALAELPEERPGPKGGWRKPPDAAD